MVAGKLGTRTQLDDYGERAESLIYYNVKDFFADTYEKYEKVNEAGPSDISIGDGKDVNNLRRGRLPGTRHPYIDGAKPNRVRLVRQHGHETVPLYLGRWFPRNDRPEDRANYVLLMLSLLKPWRRVTDITAGFDSIEAAWEGFVSSCSEDVADVISNIQYFYRCSDQSAARREREVKTNAADYEEIQRSGCGAEFQQMEEEPVADADVYEAQETEGMAQELYAYTAMECAFDAGVFDRECDIGSEAAMAGRCSINDMVDFQQWQQQLMEYTVAGGDLVVNDVVNIGGRTAEEHRHSRVVERDSEVIGNSQTIVGGELRKVLNEEQARAHDIVVDHVVRTMKGESPQQLFMLLLGPGGTGKTVVINAINETIQNLHVESWLAKTATTGVAASHFGGKTLHSWAGIKVAAKATEDLIGNASASVQKRRTANIGPSRYLILDECSMATKELIGRTSTICSHVATVGDKPGCDRYFGGMNVVLCGDFHQFPPVGQPNAALYVRNAPGANSYAVLGHHLYTQFTTVVTLKQQIRVRDTRWMELLDRLRVGGCNADDMEELQKLRLDLDTNPRVDFNAPGWNSSILITPRNSVRRKWNRAAIRRHCKTQGTRLYSCPAEDTIAGVPLSNEQLLRIARMDSKRTSNLEHRVEIAVGMKAMILANIATEADLANGTRGTVTDIILDHREPLEHEERDGAVLLRYPPAIVYFKPDGETRVRLEGFPEGLLPIVPQEGKFVAGVNEKKTRTILRRQLALTPGYAFTDLKGQGQTIEYVIVDLARPNYGSKLDAFGAYVSLSRSV